jgi:flagellar hook protein FlgE
MIRAMYSGISGMRGFQTKLDVISNNVANVNTTGYKLARTTFRDILSQTVAAGTVPNQDQGGINARQIGLGVGVASIDTIFTQGSAQSTGVKTDLMIEGDGFFVVSETASGSALGNTATKASVSIAALDETSVTLDIQRPTVTAGSTDVAQYRILAAEGDNAPTERAVINVEDEPYIATGLTAGSTYKFTIEALDADGNVIEGYTSNDLEVIMDPNTNQIGKSSSDSIGLLFTRAGNFYFDKNRNLVTADGLFVMDTEGKKITIDPQAVAYNIDERGFIVQVNNKGEQILESPQIGIAKFANPQGLEKVGSTRYRYTRVADADDQPKPYIFKPDTFEKGTGKIRSGFLEMSNVDLGVEFSEMIVSQRGFQANTRIITTSDELLQEVVNLKR